MTISVEPTSTRNNQAMNALILGIAAIVFALLANAPGIVSFLGFLSLIAALLAVIAGVRALRRDSGAQRTQALVGMLAGIVGAILFVVFLANQTNNALKLMGPQTFTGNGVQLIYPGSWQVIDTSQISTCKQTGATCVMVVSQPDGTNLNMIKVPLSQPTTLDTAFDSQLWQQFLSTAPTANRTLNDTLTVGGQPATRWLFDIPSDVTATPASSHNYFLQVHVIQGQALYEITATATSADLLSAHRADIDSIIASIRFTS